MPWEKRDKILTCTQNNDEMPIIGVFNSIDFRFQRMIGTDQDTVFLDVRNLAPNRVELGQA